MPQTHGAAGKGKGSKGKRSAQKEKRKLHDRSDDIPPEPSQDVKESADCLAELKEHLLCQTHSDTVKRAYCWIDRGTDKVKGDHRQLDYEELTLWAKHMVSKRFSAVTDKISSTDIGTWQDDKVLATEHQEIQPTRYKEATHRTPNTGSPHRSQHRTDTWSTVSRNGGVIYHLQHPYQS